MNRATICACLLVLVGCGDSAATLCGQAYDAEIADSLRTMEEGAVRYPTVRATTTLAWGEREGFVARCGALSADEARCVSRAYVAEHMDECRPHAAAVRGLAAPQALTLDLEQLRALRPAP